MFNDNNASPKYLRRRRKKISRYNTKNNFRSANNSVYWNRKFLNLTHIILLFISVIQGWFWTPKRIEVSCVWSFAHNTAFNFRSQQYCFMVGHSRKFECTQTFLVIDSFSSAYTSKSPFRDQKTAMNNGAFSLNCV